MAPVAQTVRMPAWFLTHGGGPMPLLYPNHANNSGLVTAMKKMAASLTTKPKAILLISGHHEEDVPTVVTSEKPGMLYDYYNFPPEAYEIEYPAFGNPELAAKVQSLLREAGIRNKAVKERGFDHGAFVPLITAFPKGDIPVVQLSLASNLDPKFHINVGHALAPLRDEGVLIIGSGSSFHNISALLGREKSSVAKSEAFDSWLQETLAGTSSSSQEREAKFSEWRKAPYASYAHPREEHLIPAHVALGAALGSKAEVTFGGHAMGAACSSYSWA